MQEHYFETADIDLAATILATVGAPLVGVNRNDPFQVRFIFRREEVLPELIEAYNRCDLRVEPVTFCLMRRYLSRRVSEDAGDESIPSGFNALP